MTARERDVFRLELEERSTNRAVLRRLRQAILDGTLSPGERLREADLASRFGISRNPVREALHRLEAEGLVTIRPYCGAVVAQIDVAEIQEVYELRALLEGFVAEAATPRLTTEELDRMVQILEQMKRVGAADEFETWVTLNRDFHFTLYRASQKPRMLALIDQYFHHIRRNIQLYLAAPDTLRRAEIEHQAIYDAARQRQPSSARRAVEHHIMSSLTGLIAYLQAPLSRAGNPADSRQLNPVEELPQSTIRESSAQ